MWVHLGVKILNGTYPEGIKNGMRLGSPHAVTKGGKFE
jgi:hypothetical protein